jgi:dTDP-glucose 4,6-dehydratase
MKRVLVTGGCGFLGAAYVRYRLDQSDRVELTNFDALTYAAQPERLADLSTEPRYRFVEGDVADPDAVAELFTRLGPFDVVLHFAAETHVDRSLKDARPFVRTNVAGTQVMLDAFRRQAHGKFTQVSTDEVYGPAPEGEFFAESAPLYPRNPYAATKAGADHLALAACRSFGLDLCIVRSVNVYGPGQYPEKFIPLAVTTLLAGGKIPLYGDGRQVRDWLYVDDYVEGVHLIETAGEPGEIYHLAAQDERPNRAVAEAICGLCGVPVADGIEHVDDRPGHDRRYGLDATKMRGLGWRPETDFGKGLRVTVEYFKTHRRAPAPADRVP